MRYQTDLELRLGAVTRATKREIAQLAMDPEWWPDILARIADGGNLAELLRERAWAWGGLWAWIQEDEERVAGYDSALRARAQRLAFEAVDEIELATMEDVPLRKFRVDAKLKIAGKWDRSRYGESQDVKHSGVIGMSLMSVLASLPRAGAERVVAEQPAQIGMPDDAALAQTLKSAFKAEYVVATEVEEI